MRVAAGVLLILAGVINFFAGLVFLGTGAVVGSADKLMTMAADAQKQQGQEVSPEQKEQIERYQRMDPAERAKMNSAARVGMAYGLFLLVTAGTSIAGAVCLFRSRAVKFIVVAAALALAVEVVGCVLAAVVLGVGVGATKLLFSSIGIIAGILALFGARQVSVAAAAAAAEPAPVVPASG